MITKNGGTTWQTSDYLKTESFGTTCVYFTDKNNGWISGGSNIYKTSNGGENWILDYSSSTGTIGANDMYFLNENCGWLINWEGQIYKYTN
mgnify:CR=1 FL=1